jgi:hypothetical protein
VRVEVLDAPTYAHGGHRPVRFGPQVEVVHMQGFLIRLRDDARAQAWLLERAIATHLARERAVPVRTTALAG